MSGGIQLSTAQSRISSWSNWAEYIANAPPGVAYEGKDFFKVTSVPMFLLPPIKVFCSGECQDERYFDAETPWDRIDGSLLRFFAVYFCRHCKRDFRTIVFEGFAKDEDWQHQGSIKKIGQEPPFGPNMPSRLITLIGPDRDLFLKGRRAESLGLGIGAYTYYRRVVENQKNRLIDKIIAVEKTTGSSDEAIQLLESAKADAQFSKALNNINEAIPESLRIAGRHNPLTLLYATLSDGVHNLSDEDCLSLAHDIRTLLQELARRLATALEEDSELKASLSRLLQRQSQQN